MKGLVKNNYNYDNDIMQYLLLSLYRRCISVARITVKSLCDPNGRDVTNFCTI